MASNALFTLSAIDEKSLTTPTSTQQFPLGAKISIQNPFTLSPGSTTVKEYIYVKAASVLAATSLYVIDYSATAGAEVATVAPASSSGVYRQFGVAPQAFTNGYYGWLQTKGQCKVLAEGATTAGHVAIAANGKVTLTTAGNATFAVTTVAMCLIGGTGAITYNLLGTRATVA